MWILKLKVCCLSVCTVPNVQFMHINLWNTDSPCFVFLPEHIINITFVGVNAIISKSSKSRQNKHTRFPHGMQLWCHTVKLSNMIVGGGKKDRHKIQRSRGGVTDGAAGAPKKINQKKTHRAPSRTETA